MTWSDDNPPWQPGMFEGAGTDGLRIPARLVSDATIAHTQLGGLAVSATGPDSALTPAPYTAILCDGGAFHYFHLMETVSWLWAIQHRFFAGRPPARIVLSIAWDDPRQCGIGRQLMQALYPGTEILDPNMVWPRTFQNVLILHRSWAQMKVNKYLEAAMGFASPHIQALCTTVRRAAGARQGTRRGTNILYVTRPPPRCLRPQPQAELLNTLRRVAPCTIIDFAVLPWPQQVRQAAANDVMISVHGNGLTNAFWMRPGSLLVELFPSGMRAYDYQFTAELCGLAYAGFEGDRVFTAGDRTPQYGDAATSAGPVPSLNIAKIAALISTF